jgi:mRNA interferase RelE/StbE
MALKLRFMPEALKDFQALDNSVRVVFVKKLAARLENPIVPKDALSGDLSGAYKLKDNKTGHRLVYELDEEQKVLVVTAVGKRADLAVYSKARDRRKA